MNIDYDVTCTDKDLDRALERGTPTNYSGQYYHIALAIGYAGYMIAKALCSIATAIKYSKK